MKNKNGGFTLVELVVCIVLIGLLSAAFVPGIGMVYRQDVRKATELICADLVMLRDQSNATGIKYELAVTSEKNGYTLSPSIIGDGNGRTGSKNDGINLNIQYDTYTMIKSPDGTYIETPIDKIYYKSGKLFDARDTSIDKLKVSVSYDSGARVSANIIYDGVTGHYTVTY